MQTCKQQNHIISFVRQFISNPFKVGAIAPSSEYLAEMMTDSDSLKKARVVVELGPGTGVFTSKICEKKSDRALFFAIEINRDFAEMVSSQNPGVPVYCGCASEISKFLSNHNAKKVDCIISGLPWAAFSADIQDKILDNAHKYLKKGGEFITFAYVQGVCLPSGIRFRKKLHDKFRRIEYSPIVWKNFPPAFVYRCKK